MTTPDTAAAGGTRWANTPMRCAFAGCLTLATAIYQGNAWCPAHHAEAQQVTRDRMQRRRMAVLPDLSQVGDAVDDPLLDLEAAVIATVPDAGRVLTDEERERYDRILGMGSNG